MKRNVFPKCSLRYECVEAASTGWTKPVPGLKRIKSICVVENGPGVTSLQFKETFLWIFYEIDILDAV